MAELVFRARDYVVIATHNHDFDQEVLAATLKTKAGYVGMIGSSRKVAKVCKALRLEGFSPDDLARAHAPIGLDISAETPEEIAVSIMGELIRHRRERASSKTTRGAAITSLSSKEER